MIKEFFITKLYEERNVRIKFDQPYKILVAENGYGKTTILNSFYALLSGEISKLRKISFESIGVVFNDGVSINFNKSEFDADLAIIKNNPLFEHIESRFGQDFILQLLDDIRRYPDLKMDMSAAFRRVQRELDLPAQILLNNLRELRPYNNKKKVNSSTQEKLLKISKKLNLKTLYLPTYRRVEEDIRVFNTNKEHQHSSINFGMQDVQESI